MFEASATVLPSIDFQLARQAAEELGFPLFGWVDLEPAWDIYQAHFERYQKWIHAEGHASMGYLSRGMERRSDPRKVFPDTRSVLVVGRPYSAAPLTSPGGEVKYARYLRGSDYHHHMASDLETLMVYLREKCRDNVTHPPGLSSLSWKVCVDTSAVLERSWAAIAGLGWIGKNTLLIHPHWGSYVLLGVVLINACSGRGPALLPNYCGNCARCVTSCPTQAIEIGWGVRSSECISYRTLECRSANLSERAGWLAGCDICQEVCPYNKKTERKTLGFPPLEQRFRLSADELMRESSAAYQERIRGSSYRRVKWEQQRQNLQALQSDKTEANKDAAPDHSKPETEA